MQFQRIILVWLSAFVLLLVLYFNFKEAKWAEEKRAISGLFVITTIAFMTIPTRRLIAANIVNKKLIQKIQIDSDNNILFIQTLSNSTFNFAISNINTQIEIRMSDALLYFLEDSTKSFNRLFVKDFFYIVKFDTKSFFLLTNLFEDPELVKNFIYKLKG